MRDKMSDGRHWGDLPPRVKVEVKERPVSEILAEMLADAERFDRRTVTMDVGLLKRIMSAPLAEEQKYQSVDERCLPSSMADLSDVRARLIERARLIDGPSTSGPCRINAALYLVLPGPLVPQPPEGAQLEFDPAAQTYRIIQEQKS